MKKRYSDYQADHLKVEEAVACCLSNPSSVLETEISNIKNKIDSISIDNWQDSSATTFNVNKNTTSLKLGIILTSITNVFKKSEQVYDLTNQQLDKFKLIDEIYQDILDQKPKQSDYKKKVEENGGLVERNDTSAYEAALSNWEKSKTSAEVEMQGCTDQIEKYFQILDEINSVSISMSASMPFITSQVPEVYSPKSVVFKNINMQLAKNMVLYKYNGSEYYVMDTPNMDFSKIPSIHGKQPSGGCLTWSDYYVNDIFDNSESVPILSSYQELLSKDKNEILKIMASEVMAGRPAIIHVTGVHQRGDIYSRHFVTVAGIKETADLDNLQESDFLIMDPTLPGLKPLDTKKGSYTTRSLLKCEKATYRADSSNEGYAVLVYNDPKQYVTNTCREAKI